MVTLFKRPDGETTLDDRIAALSRRQRLIPSDPPSQPAAPPSPQDAPLPGQQGPTLGPGPGPSLTVPVEPAAPSISIEERLKAAREELIARLTVEIRPERRSQLTRGDLAKIVDAAVQAYFIRFALDANPLERRDLVTAIMQALLVAPGAAETGGRAPAHRRP